MAIYCIEQDLYKVLSDLDSYDLKQDLLENDFVNSAGIVWELNDSGSVTTLYRDGEDLGAPQADAISVVTDSQWYYGAAEDKLTLATTNAPNTFRIGASPEDWVATKSAAMEDASDELESLLDVSHPRPLPKTQNSNSGRDYDFILVKVSSILAVISLVMASDPVSNRGLIQTLNNMLYNETETGYIDRINKGEIKFSWEVTQSDRIGNIEPVILDPTTTGDLVDPVGQTTVEYGVMLVTIATGGTITTGVDNTTVTYDVTDGEGNDLVTDEVITTLYQTMGFGITARFTDGIYVTGDQWRIEVKGTPTKSTTFSYVRSTR